MMNKNASLTGKPPSLRLFASTFFEWYTQYEYFNKMISGLDRIHCHQQFLKWFERYPSTVVTSDHQRQVRLSVYPEWSLTS